VNLLDFKIEKKPLHNKDNYSDDIVKVAFKFTKEIHKELGDLVKAVVLFGSAARKKQDVGDIDILLVVDDIGVVFSKELTQTYRIIVEKTVQKVDKKLHVTSMKFTSFWEYVRGGDPIALNMLRDGFALYDTGFFEPIQLLLNQGRIKPSPEALWAYFNRAPNTLRMSKIKILEACVDLYWAVIDSAHSALMSLNIVPPSPEHVADLLDEKLVKPKLLEKKYSWTMRKFYDLSKRITHKEIRSISGKEYDEYYKEALEFVQRIEKFIKK
jgi:predicted nucleotidyltransferase/uncharacterized protein (UPF0332 family)